MESSEFGIKKKHENSQSFADWFFRRKKRETFALKDIRKKVREYQKRHPNIDLHTANFNEHRTNIHPSMPSIYTIRNEYKKKYRNKKGFTNWLFRRTHFSLEEILEEIKQQVRKYQKLHPNIHLNTVNFDEHRTNIHPDMPSIHTIKEWYKKKHENLKGFTDWIFSRTHLSLEDIREKSKRISKTSSKHSSQYCTF